MTKWLFPHNYARRAIFFLFIIEAIRLLYVYERELQQLPDEPQEVFLERVRNNRNCLARKVVGYIDEIVNYMQKGMVVKVGKRYKAAPNTTPQQAAALTYYLNNRSELTTFLKDPRVPLDTNAVERCIRPVSCLEGTTKYRQTASHMQTMCDIFTLFETAKRNGISRPEVSTASKNVGLRNSMKKESIQSPRGYEFGTCQS